MFNGVASLYICWQFFYIETLLARYLKNYLSWGLDIWYTTWGWDIHYMIIFWANSVKFEQSYGPLQILHWNSVSQISQNLLEVGRWYLVYWLGMRCRLPDWAKSVKIIRSYGLINFWANFIKILRSFMTTGSSLKLKLHTMNSNRKIVIHVVVLHKDSF